VDRKLAEGIYAVGLIVILLALTRASPAVGTSLLLLTATMGDIRVVRKNASKISTKPGLLERTLRRVGGQIAVLALVLLDIGGLGFSLAAQVWLAPWVITNLTVLVLGTLSWRERREAQRQQQAEQAERLRQVEQQLRDAEQRRSQEEEERKAQRGKQAEQAERLRQAEQQLIPPP